MVYENATLREVVFYHQIILISELLKLLNAGISSASTEVGDSEE